MHTLGAVCESVCLDMDHLFEESGSKPRAMNDFSATGKTGTVLCVREEDPSCIIWLLLTSLPPFKAIQPTNRWSPFLVHKSVLQEPGSESV